MIFTVDEINGEDRPRANKHDFYLLKDLMKSPSRRSLNLPFWGSDDRLVRGFSRFGELGSLGLSIAYTPHKTG